jgi:hypothetical protein
MEVKLLHIPFGKEFLPNVVAAGLQVSVENLKVGENITERWRW